MPGIAVALADRHRDANERRMEELERERDRLADAGGRLVAINDTLHTRVVALEAVLALIGKHAELPVEAHSWRVKRDAIRALAYEALGTETITIAMCQGACGVPGEGTGGA